jgi:pimeloyl-ACP methyl ester carboxylesterase
MAARRRIGRLVAVDLPQFRGPVHVHVEGPPAAPAILLLHGFSGSMHWFDLVIPLLDRDFQLIRVDLVGHGGTGGRAVDAPVQAAVVDEVLAALDVDEVTAVGHSFGADVAVDLAEHSARVGKLAIVAQAPDYSDATLPRASGLVTVPVLGSALPLLARALATGVATLRRSRLATQPLARQALADFRALHGGMFRVVVADRRDRMAARPLDAQVRAAGKPTLVVLGEIDHLYGARSAQRYRAAGATVHVLAETGHSPFVERPVEIAALLREFLTAPLPDGA